jgi:hypothetical protein
MHAFRAKQEFAGEGARATFPSLVRSSAIQQFGSSMGLSLLLDYWAGIGL